MIMDWDFLDKSLVSCLPHSSTVTDTAPTTGTTYLYCVENKTLLVLGIFGFEQYIIKMHIHIFNKHIFTFYYFTQIMLVVLA